MHLPYKIMLLLLLACISACTTPPVNHSFSVSIRDANADLKRMKSDPRPLPRPLLILSGISEPGIAPLMLSDSFEKTSDDHRIISVTFPILANMEECRQIVIHTVEKNFPCDDPSFTTEVDVIGLSMGGVIGRFSASTIPLAYPSASHKKLRIHRLFTIGSPHRGANLADLPPLNSQHIDLRKDSDFIKRLNTPGVDGAGPGGYRIVAYCRLEDGIVGAANSAPPHQTPRWVHRPFFEPGHVGSMFDVRIIADIARQLRNEEPWSHDPPQPLPAT
ncbi:hypothetical protein BH11VER1_BH11VER1_05850 [soil metagenome]